MVMDRALGSGQALPIAHDYDILASNLLRSEHLRELPRCL